MITHADQGSSCDLNEEVQALRHLKHPNIVAYEEMIRLPTCTYICMEYCPGGDLRDVLDVAIESKSIIHLSKASLIDNLFSKRIEESRIQTIFAQLILALHHCHHAYLGGWTLLHRDIKPENVLFTSEGKVKLADFGLSRFLGGDERQAFSFAGTPGYFAPEILSGKPYDAKADMYSLGCLLFEMCTLTAYIINESDLDFSIMTTGRIKYAPELKACVQDLLQPVVRNAVSEVLAHDLGCQPNNRPSTADLLSRRTIGAWLQLAGRNGMQDDLAEREEQVLLREAAVRSRERAMEAKEASIEVQFRRLAYRQSATPSPGREIKEVTRSPSPNKPKAARGRKKAA